MPETVTPGQIAYEAYAEDYWPGHCPPYELLGRDEQRAWDAAAQAVLAWEDIRQKHQDAATGGRNCPACEGADIAHGNDTTFTNCTVRRVLLCEDCGAGWKAVYTLTGYEDLRLPIRQRRNAVCAVCRTTLEAGAVYCPAHPEAQVHILLED